MAAVQTVLAYRFIHHDYTTYLDTAFNFDREFLYKWTVNWRMIPEEIFSSPEWSKGLLLGHVFVLVAFGWFQWCKQHGGVLVVLRRGLSRPGGPTATDPLSADCGLLLAARVFFFMSFQMLPLFSSLPT